MELETLEIPTMDLHELERMFSEEEVWNTIRELPSDRAPGPDGFTGAFYQRAWPVIKHDIMAGVRKLGVGDGRGFGRLNRALITLIPKRQDAMEVKDFRPISLVHSFSKLFSKMLANRLRGRLGELISMNQSAFVKKRSLHDNFVLVRQVARKINSMRNTGVLLKLDLARAFDSLSWSFLFEVLRRMGFGERFLKWIALLLYTANTRVLVNGVPGERIVHARGLRQGDPTSPMLFVAAMEVLSATIKKAVEGDMFSNLAGISLLQRISIYADDVVLFFKPERREMLVIKHILQIFGEASGLKFISSFPCPVLAIGKKPFSASMASSSSSASSGLSFDSSSSSELEPEVNLMAIYEALAPEYWDARDWDYSIESEDDEPLTDGEEDLRFLVDGELEAASDDDLFSWEAGFSSDEEDEEAEETEEDSSSAGTHRQALAPGRTAAATVRRGG
ncbi:hypothetical protein QYE76_005116 [Lolium multiflorum]|uniref:Reverse transcriptase domain-containing protein n=1 Tax=Lolium multiflorum TaxID=4521 RepID=A0AAD8RS01_LOLMU|nr:hypothetical protein QYE76_005116 [Lolium multiflorum]